MVLGCFGRNDDGFVSCPGVENRILKLDDSLVYLDEIMDYLDSVRLFDKHMLDVNAIRHLIYNLQDRYDQKVKRLWTEKQHHLYEKFVIGHKPCGVYAKLVLVSDEISVPKPTAPKRVFVKGTPEPLQFEKQPVLKVVRTRR